MSLPTSPQVFQEVQRFARLLRWPAVSAAVQPEKEKLAGLVDKYLDNLQSQLEDHRDAGGHGRGGGAGTPGRNISSVADDIAWAIQVRGGEPAVQHCVLRSCSGPADCLQAQIRWPACRKLLLGFCLNPKDLLETC